MLRDSSYLKDRAVPARYLQAHAQPCCPSIAFPQPARHRPARPFKGAAMTIVGVYIGAFLASLVVVGVLGWLLLWPSQR